jgi:hypothetical protein
MVCCDHFGQSCAMKAAPGPFLDRTAQHGITFAVHDVEPEIPAAPHVSMADSLKECMRSGEDFVAEIVAVSDAEGHYLELPSQNGLLAAVLRAIRQGARRSRRSMGSKIPGGFFYYRND